MPIKLSREKQEGFCNAWRISGLTKTKFCKQNNISKSGLYNWLNKFNANSKATVDSGQSTAIKFLQINDIKSANGCPEDSVLEIKIPNGIIIKINLSKNNLSNFLQELLKWK